MSGKTAQLSGDGLNDELMAPLLQQLVERAFCHAFAGEFEGRMTPGLLID
jgi:hypothetical protein